MEVTAYFAQEYFLHKGIKRTAVNQKYTSWDTGLGTTACNFACVKTFSKVCVEQAVVLGHVWRF
jgi:hypothetical protein